MGSVQYKEMKILDKAQSDLQGDLQRLQEQETSSLVLDICNNPIPRDWINMFSGFFWGEGCMHFRITNHGKSFSPTAAIKLRKDDKYILEEFQSKLGGTFSTAVEGINQRPQVHWSVNRLDGCLRISQVLSQSIALPFRKRLQLAVWKEALELKLVTRERYGPHGGGTGRATRRPQYYFERMGALNRQLKALKKYEEECDTNTIT